eukprot:GCRY01007955.1.p1 GENE.GCRY01007955.1~~GCRY01007955.1.p1  ORF type:complete len:137 (-),score=49.55 GCRY01007955.1:135-545(-)
MMYSFFYGMSLSPGQLDEQKDYVGRQLDHTFKGPETTVGAQGYKREVVLEHKDKHGNLLTPKEAFRQICYKFHGKGPSKNKLNKRLEQIERRDRIKKGEATDTPLGSLKALKEEQEKTNSAFVLLSGGVGTKKQVY